MNGIGIIGTECINKQAIIIVCTVCIITGAGGVFVAGGGCLAIGHGWVIAPRSILRGAIAHPYPEVTAPCARVLICVYMCIYICMYIYMHIHACICIMCVCICICICICDI